MATIIAGRFEQQDQAIRAAQSLMDAGFSATRISSFFVNPAGQHDIYPIGGDRDQSPGAKRSDEGVGKGISTGGAIGAVLGVASAPVVGPAGPVLGTLLGADVGALMGSLAHMDDAEHTPELRRSGVFVAVDTAQDAELEEKAIGALRTCGAMDIERAEGNINDGDWKDFDPRSSPKLIEKNPTTP